jgi:hypothetical protein
LASGAGVATDRAVFEDVGRQTRQLNVTNDIRYARHEKNRNGTNLIYDLKGAQVVLLDAPQASGFSLPGRWQTSVEAAVNAR